MKFVIILNKKITIAQALNTTSHMMAALVEAMAPEQRRSIGIIDYKDADGRSHYASKWPHTIFKADNSDDIRKIRAVALGLGLNYVDFTSEMIGGDYNEKIKRSKNTKEIDLEYYGAAIFGSKDEIEEATREYALYS